MHLFGLPTLPRLAEEAPPMALFGVKGPLKTPPSCFFQANPPTTHHQASKPPKKQPLHSKNTKNLFRQNTRKDQNPQRPKKNKRPKPANTDRLWSDIMAFRSSFFASSKLSLPPETPRVAEVSWGFGEPWVLVYFGCKKGRLFDEFFCRFFNAGFLASKPLINLGFAWFGFGFTLLDLPSHPSQQSAWGCVCTRAHVPPGERWWPLNPNKTKRVYKSQPLFRIKRKPEKDQKKTLLND